jgi:hypothetical protein
VVSTQSTTRYAHGFFFFFFFLKKVHNGPPTCWWQMVAAHIELSVTDGPRLKAAVTAGVLAGEKYGRDSHYAEWGASCSRKTGVWGHAVMFAGLCRQSACCPSPAPWKLRRRNRSRAIRKQGRPRGGYAQGKGGSGQSEGRGNGCRLRAGTVTGIGCSAQAVKIQALACNDVCSYQQPINPRERGKRKME